MMIFAHAAVGAALVYCLSKKKVPLVLALILAFLSHFVLDSIPHWNQVWPWPLHFELLWPTMVDGLVALVVLFIIFGKAFYKNPLVLAGAAMAVLPDFLLAVEFALGTRSPIFAVHQFVQYNWPILPGLLTQTTIVVLLILFCRIKRQES